MLEWRSRRYLEQHFRKHGRSVGATTIEEYDQSAREVAEHGTYFEYRDPKLGAWRIGYYDVDSERFVALADDDATILTHFRCPERYVVFNLPGSTYT